MRIKIILLFLLFFSFIFSSVVNAEEISLTLDEAVAIALRENRDILLKTEEVKKAKAKISEANAGLFPTLSFTGSWTDTRGYYAKDVTQTSTQTTLKQYLYKGGKTINTIRYNGYNLEVAKAILDKEKLETVLNVKKAFYTLLLTVEFAHLNKNILDNTQEHLIFLRARQRNGQASESDILKVESSLSSVKEAYETSLNQIEASQSLLNNLLFLDKETKVKPDAQFIYEPKEVAFDEAFLKAMRMSPEIRQYEAQEKASLKAIEIAKADSRPSIYASWDYYSRSRTSLSFSPTKGWQDYNIIGFTFSWPIFDGWATKAKVEQAIVDLKEAQLLKEKAVSDAALELKNAYLALKNAIAKITSAELDSVFYKDTLLVIEQKYRRGVASSLDLDDANLSYNVSLFNHKQAIYDYIIAKSNFDKATGGI